MSPPFWKLLLEGPKLQNLLKAPVYPLWARLPSLPFHSVVPKSLRTHLLNATLHLGVCLLGNQPATVASEKAFISALS